MRILKRDKYPNASNCHKFIFNLIYFMRNYYQASLLWESKIYKAVMNN